MFAANNQCLEVHTHYAVDLGALSPPPKKKKSLIAWKALKPAIRLVKMFSQLFSSVTK